MNETPAWVNDLPPKTRGLATRAYEATRQVLSNTQVDGVLTLTSALEKATRFPNPTTDWNHMPTLMDFLKDEYETKVQMPVGMWLALAAHLEEAGETVEILQGEPYPAGSRLTSAVLTYTPAPYRFKAGDQTYTARINRRHFEDQVTIGYADYYIMPSVLAGIEDAAKDYNSMRAHDSTRVGAVMRVASAGAFHNPELFLPPWHKNYPATWIRTIAGPAAQTKMRYELGQNLYREHLGDPDANQEASDLMLKGVNRDHQQYQDYLVDPESLDINLDYLTEKLEELDKGVYQLMMPPAMLLRLRAHYQLTGLDGASATWRPRVGGDLDTILVDANGVGHGWGLYVPPADFNGEDAHTYVSLRALGNTPEVAREGVYWAKPMHLPRGKRGTQARGTGPAGS